MSSAQYWIDQLQLQRHPEGGWFREVYRAEESIPHSALPPAYSGDRNYSTSIYFLLNGNDTSTFHKINQDELWHFYAGTSLTLHMIDPSGEYSTQQVGNQLDKGQTLMFCVPAGWYFGAEVDDKNSFSLVGCTVAPGFDFDDFEMPSAEELIMQYPQNREIIERLAANEIA